MGSTKGLSTLILGCLLMGSMGVFAHFIEGTHPINVLLYRFTFSLAGFLVIAALCLAFSPKSANAYIKSNLSSIKKHPVIYLFTGLVSALVMATYVWGTLLFSLGMSVVMLYTASIYLPFAEKMMRRYFLPNIPKTSFGTKYYVSSAINLTGLLLIVGSTLSNANLNVVGLVSAISSGFFFSIMMVMVRALKSVDVAPEHTLISGIAVGFVLFIPFAFILPVTISASNIGFATGLGAFATTIGGIFYFKGFSSVRADIAPLIAYFEPIFGSLLALIFLGEKYSLLAIVGVLLIIGTNFVYTICSRKALK